MTKRASAKAQPDTGTTSTDTSPESTGRLQPVHFDELYAIWPADPRMPSVESRQAWAHARNVTPTYVHNWFQRRRPVAKRLRLRIPPETYELPVGTPPVIVTVKDEPVESELLATTDEAAPAPTNSRPVRVRRSPDLAPVPSTQQRKKKTKSAAADPPLDNDVPASKTKKNPKEEKSKSAESPRDDNDAAESVPKNNSKKKRKVPAELLCDDDAAAESAPRVRRNRNQSTESPNNDLPEPMPPKKKTKLAPVPPRAPIDDATIQPKRSLRIKAEGKAVPMLSAPRQEPKKRTTKAHPEPATAHATDVVAPTERSRKRLRNTEAEPVHDDAPQPKRKKKIAPVNDHPEPIRKKKTVRFDTPNPDTPPSSSPTLRASSVIPSDAATVVDDTPPSTPSAKTAIDGAYPHEKSIPNPDINAHGSLSPTSTTDRSPKENQKPLKSAPKKTKRAKKRKGKATPTPMPEEEEVLVCDRGNPHTPTGFTCVLCSPTTDDLVVAGEVADDIVSDMPKEDFDWIFEFPSFTGPPGDYTGICVDLTPLSAIPFLAASVPVEPSTDIAPQGYMEIDNLQFTYDGTYVGDGQFFPTFPNGWKSLDRLMLDSAGDWVHPDDHPTSSESSSGNQEMLFEDGSVYSNPRLWLPADIF
ncbi:hypothetical protein C8R46DRAFT_1086702 [Mycena filopes]|nr:hypothetical protein C8R46DRAFT_1086702 [Mycena filopes]